MNVHIRLDQDAKNALAGLKQTQGVHWRSLSWFIREALLRAWAMECQEQARRTQATLGMEDTQGKRSRLYRGEPLPSRYPAGEINIPSGVKVPPIRHTPFHQLPKLSNGEGNEE